MNESENIVLKPRYLKFAQGIINGDDQYVAYKNAGFKCKNNSVARKLASRLMTKEDIRNYIAIHSAKVQAEAEEKDIITVLETLQELVRLGTADPSNIFDERGNIKNIKDIDENTRKAIASVEVDEIKVAGVTVGQTKKVKFWNKNEALNTIAKHLGMLIDRKDITSTIIIKELNALKPAQLKQLAESVN